MGALAGQYSIAHNKQEIPILNDDLFNLEEAILTT